MGNNICCSARSHDEAVEVLLVQEAASGPKEVDRDLERHTLGSSGRDLQAITMNSPLEVESSLVQLVVEGAARRLENRRLTDFQRQFCTPENVKRYLDARDGRVSDASEILADALKMREEAKDVLTFVKEPKWSSDFRVLARGEDGHTCAYFCMRSQPSYTSPQMALDSIFQVLEVAVKQLANGATTFDIICDWHGFQLRKNLDVRVAMAFARVLKNPYRDRLRMGIVVDPGFMFTRFWKAFAPGLPKKTREKIVMASREEALSKLSQLGPSVATAVEQAMTVHRSNLDVKPRQPTELDDVTSGSGFQEVARERCLE